MLAFLDSGSEIHLTLTRIARPLSYIFYSVAENENDLINSPKEG